MTAESKKNLNQPITKEGISFNTLVKSPSETITSLQVVCFFDFQKNQYYEGGTYAVNEHFGGEIHQIRQSGIFRGEKLETLLITPVRRQIPATQLLLIGLGDPEALNLELITSLGYAATLAAIQLGVKDFCFAPSLKDAGIVMSFQKTDISEQLAKGALKAIHTAKILVQTNLLPPIVLKEINLLAGEAQAVHAYEGLEMALNSTDFMGHN